MTPHQNRLSETVLMRGQNVHFKGVLWKIIPKLSLLPLLIWSTVTSWFHVLHFYVQYQRIPVGAFGGFCCIEVTFNREAPWSRGYIEMLIYSYYTDFFRELVFSILYGNNLM